LRDVKHFTKSSKLKRRKPYKPGTLKVSTRKYSALVGKVFIAGLFIAFVAVSYKYIFVSKSFQISKFNIVGAGEFVNAGDINTLVSGQVLGINVFKLDLEEVATVVQDNFLGVKDVQVTRQIPNSIKITVEERIPLVTVCNTGGACYFIDKEGFVLGLADDRLTGLPRIEYPGDILIGSSLDREIIPVSFEILEHADNHNLRVSSVSYHPRYTEMHVKPDVTVLIGHDKSRPAALRIVKALLKKAAEEDVNIEKIDLRYVKVGVSYE
jgi:hypothetical protein